MWSLWKNVWKDLFGIFFDGRQLTVELRSSFVLLLRCFFFSFVFFLRFGEIYCTDRLQSLRQCPPINSSSIQFLSIFSWNWAEWTLSRWIVLKCPIDCCSSSSLSFELIDWNRWMSTSEKLNWKFRCWLNIWINRNEIVKKKLKTKTKTKNKKKNGGAAAFIFRFLVSSSSFLVFLLFLLVFYLGFQRHFEFWRLLRLFLLSLRRRLRKASGWLQHFMWRICYVSTTTTAAVSIKKFPLKAKPFCERKERERKNFLLKLNGSIHISLLLSSSYSSRFILLIHHWLIIVGGWFDGINWLSTIVRSKNDPNSVDPFKLPIQKLLLKLILLSILLYYIIF